MKTEHRAVFLERFKIWFKGNEPAVNACLDLLDIAHLWDDLVDGDTEIDPDHADHVMRTAMLDLPLNPFWSENLRVLQPLLYSAYLQWETANVFEESEQFPEKAYMLRASIYQIFPMVALIIGGADWAKQVSIETWQVYGETVQSFQVVGGTDA